GSIFVMVNDRRINSIEKAAGKKVVVLDWDPSMGRMISSIGAQPVPADLTSYAGKFNNGQADIIAAPAMAYQPMELYKGIGQQGGIIRFPLLQATGTVLIRRDLMLPKIPDLDTRLSQVRDYGLQHIDSLIDVLKKSEADLPKHLWVDLSADDKKKYARMLREARLYMTREGVYEPTMMNILKRVRCKHDPANEECGTFDE
ncbi:MAG TPA: putative solute-binding protein, partial [Moraxellaceae bacterium]|nr:putative solute-binding protein [Moraxellaceae bacterium]